MVKDTRPSPPPENPPTWDEVNAAFDRVIAKQIHVEPGDIVRELHPRGGQLRVGEVMEVEKPNSYPGQKECYTYARIQFPGFGRLLRIWTGDIELVRRKGEARDYKITNPPFATDEPKGVGA